jgi:Holliday junction resolvase RusA-like endonuclease
MRLVVYGNPAPQGSKKFMGRTKQGKGIIVDASDSTTPWRADVKQAAERHLEEFPVHFGKEEALLLRMVFTFRRPASVTPRKRPHPSVYPDLSKLARSTEDALTASGVWEDDAQVVGYSRLAKVYIGEDLEALDRPGCIIVIEPMNADFGPLTKEIEDHALCRCCGYPLGGLPAGWRDAIQQATPIRKAA